MQQHVSKTFAVREVLGHPECKVEADAFASIVDAVYAFSSFELSERKDVPFLFVTVVPTNTIASEDGDSGFGLYLEGLMTIAIAGEMPDEWDGTREEWLRELELSTLHELVHFEQELDGVLESTDEIEEKAEARAAKLMEEYFPVKSPGER